MLGVQWYAHVTAPSIARQSSFNMIQPQGPRSRRCRLASSSIAALAQHESISTLSLLLLLNIRDTLYYDHLITLDHDQSRKKNAIIPRQHLIGTAIPISASDADTSS